MLTRRAFIHCSLLATSGLWAAKAASAASTLLAHEWFMPDEGERHKRTWMAFGASEQIWGKDLLPKVQQELATIALTISEYELVSMLVRENELPIARELMGDSIEFIVSPLNDLWIRDTGPVFVKNSQGRLQGIDFNFNGWGHKQDYEQDAKVAALVSSKAGADYLLANLVLEGGGIEVDGHGTAIMTESCVLNSNRNPGISKQNCEQQLKSLLGLEKIIWLPGIKGKDITDGHTDFYARFVRPGVVVAGYEPDATYFDHQVTATHLKMLESATDSRGEKLAVIRLDNPSMVRPDYETDEFAAGYINYYVCNGAVIMPEFGDRVADAAAAHKIQALFPKHDVIQLNIDAIAAGGGGIHCAMQQEPQV